MLDNHEQKQKSYDKKLPNINELNKMTYTHLWNNFELNAKQRVSLFYYYVLFFTAFTAAIYHTDGKQDSLRSPVVDTVLPILFFIITIIFNLIEKRNNELIENSRKGLRQFEKQHFQNLSDNRKYKIFTNDKKKRMCCITHSTCYQAIFILGYLISFGLFAFRLIQYCNCATGN